MSIRAVSNFGVGIPIYVDLRNVRDIPYEDDRINASIHQDPRLGISIGILLSVLCVIVCIFIIVRHRRCSKSPHHRHTNGNDNNANNNFLNRSPLNCVPSSGPLMIIPTSSTQIPANCTTDIHEMQTLILTSNKENISSANGNGLSKKPDNHMNGIVVRANVNSRFDGDADLNGCSLVTSTPNSKHKTINVNNEHHKSSTIGSHTAKPLDASYRRIDCDSEPHGVETTMNNTLCNESLQLMKTTLPPNKSVHSIVYNKNGIPPTIKRSIDEKTKNAKRSSTHKSNGSIFDDCQQSLLPDTNANESSSASTSSGSVPMDRIANKANCLFDIHTFDNDAANPIIENQRYMRSAALV